MVSVAMFAFVYIRWAFMFACTGRGTISMTLFATVEAVVTFILDVYLVSLAVRDGGSIS